MLLVMFRVCWSVESMLVSMVMCVEYVGSCDYVCRMCSGLKPLTEYARVCGHVGSMLEAMAMWNMLGAMAV